MSLVERNHVYIWCHWSFLSLTCHQLGSVGNIFDVRLVHVLQTPNPASKALSVSTTPVCSDRPATMMTASRRCGRAACEPTLTCRQKEQPCRLHEYSSAPSNLRAHLIPNSQPQTTGLFLSVCFPYWAHPACSNRLFRPTVVLHFSLQSSAWNSLSWLQKSEVTMQRLWEQKRSPCHMTVKWRRTQFWWTLMVPKALNRNSCNHVVVIYFC